MRRLFQYQEKLDAVHQNQKQLLPVVFPEDWRLIQGGVVVVRILGQFDQFFDRIECMKKEYAMNNILFIIRGI